MAQHSYTWATMAHRRRALPSKARPEGAIPASADHRQPGWHPSGDPELTDAQEPRDLKRGDPPSS